MNGFSSFSGNVFAVLVYYLEMERCWLWDGCWKHCIGKMHWDMAVVSHYSIFQAFAGLPYLVMVAIFSWTGLYVENVCFSVMGSYFLGA